MSFVDLRFVSKRDVLSKMLRKMTNSSIWALGKMHDVFINYAALSSTRYTLLRIKNEDAVLLLVSFPKLTLCLAFEQKFECFWCPAPTTQTIIRSFDVVIHERYGDYYYYEREQEQEY